jgi:glycosyltransferase involved in cell wall biosynthesis
MTSTLSENRASAEAAHAPIVDAPGAVDEGSRGAPRLRVVVSTYGMSPVRGSEAATGWQHVSRLAKYHDITALCMPGVHGEIRREIETWVAQHGPVPGLSFHYVEPTFLARQLERSSTSVLRAIFTIGNASWQRAACREARALHAQRPFDLAHHLTISGYREPGYLWKLPVPFIWGPITGAADVPWRYLPIMGLRDQVAYSLRNVANSVQRRFSVRCRRAARAAKQIWAVGPENQYMVERIWGRTCEHLFEVGTVPRPDARVKEFDPRQTLRLVVAGYHVGRKALSIVLRALARLGDTVPYEMLVMGHGPAKDGWMALSHELGLDARVKWTENLPHAEALGHMQRGHALLLSSVKEGLPNVVAEALSLGLPVVCHNLCGMAQFVTDECGIRVEAVSPQQSVDGFAEAIRRLATTPGLVARLSAGALRRAQEMTWERNAQIIAAAYTRVASQHAAAHRTA